MKTNKSQPTTNEKPAREPKPSTSADLSEAKTFSLLSPDVMARRARAICHPQNTHVRYEAKPWLEAEAQLFGGVERESQLHPGSSLFTTEH